MHQANARSLIHDLVRHVDCVEQNERIWHLDVESSTAVQTTDLQQNIGTNAIVSR